MTDEKVETAGSPAKKNGNKMASRPGRLLFPACFVVIFCLALAALAAMLGRVVQASPPVPIPVKFSGEYSQNGAAWQPLTDTTRFNALNGDLALRGHFDFETDEAILYMYLDGIDMTFSVDGEEEYNAGNPCPELGNCPGTLWASWLTRGFSGKMVEIHLKNSQAIGNPNAYNDLLRQLYTSKAPVLEHYILSPSAYFYMTTGWERIAALAAFLGSGQFWRAVGVVIFVAALLLFGIALSDRLQENLFGKKLWLLGALALFAVGVMLLDTPDVQLWNGSIAFNTCMAQLCRMLWMLVLSLCAAEVFEGRRKTIAYGVAALGGALDAVLLLLCTFGHGYLTDWLLPWFVLQAAACLVLLVCCVLELKTKKAPGTPWILAALLVLLLAVAAEFGNAYAGLWQRGLLLHLVFTLLLLVCGGFAVKAVPGTYREAKQAKALEEQLAENRISIMLSQIQPHFLYNALNSVRQLCKTNPPAAQAAIDDFARYLRTNLDSLKQNTNVPFTKELEHIRTYLALEQMRFEDELRVAWDVRADEFMLPALTVQPLVENAVKYGVGKKPGGGTVTISARKTVDWFEISVADDGVGYDPKTIGTDGRTHVGIENVRQRLAAMCHGTLTVETAPGQGTTATIHIPREQVQE